jgi:hypothetical protein
MPLTTEFPGIPGPQRPQHLYKCLASSKTATGWDLGVAHLMKLARIDCADLVSLSGTLVGERGGGG